MYKLKYVFVVVVFFVVALASCQGMLEQGQIVEKRVLPAYNWIWLMPIVHSTGNTTYTTFIPIPMHSPEAYLVTLQEEGAEDPRTRTVYVPYRVFRTLEIGQCFDIKDGECQDKRPSERRDQEEVLYDR